MMVRMDRPAHDMPRVRAAGPGDLPSVLTLLQKESLATAGVAEHLPNFLVAESGASIVACAGVEWYAGAGLLRSVAVAAEYRGRGLAGSMVAELIRQATRRGLRTMVLLTTTAEHYFSRRGFVPVARESVDPELLASAEIRGACPSTAVCMRLRLPQ